MPDLQSQFELLAIEFETLTTEMQICKNPERRFALLQRMKLLLDEIFELLSASLYQDNQTFRNNPTSTPQASAP
jgi:hypothetical protein